MLFNLLTAQIVGIRNHKTIVRQSNIWKNLYKQKAGIFFSTSNVNHKFEQQLDFASRMDSFERKRVLLLYLGGTIGMKPNENGSLAPVPGYFTKVVNSMEELKIKNMPNFDIIEFDPILDSACMGPQDWVKVAEVVEKNYYSVDGFVIAMGTDTMAYTASALSFMLQNLGKAVILTGSQIPFSEAYNDARRNLIVSMMFAAFDDLHEVCIFFNDRLLRGNRSSKVNNFGLDAFDSPNFPPLATLGVNITERKGLFLAPPRSTFRVHKQMDTNIIVIKLVPGFEDEALLAMVQHCSNLKAIILELYGTGNLNWSSKKQKFIEFIDAAEKKGILVIASTQCRKGSALLHLYAAGAELIEHGVISAGDMTTEAITTKLAYLFGRLNDSHQVACELQRDMRGEISSHKLYTTNLLNKNSLENLL